VTADCQHWFDDTAKELSQKTLDAIHGAQASLSHWEPDFKLGMLDHKTGEYVPLGDPPEKV